MINRRGIGKKSAETHQVMFLLILSKKPSGELYSPQPREDSFDRLIRRYYHRKIKK